MQSDTAVADRTGGVNAAGPLELQRTPVPVTYRVHQMLQLIDTSTLREKRLAVAAAFGSTDVIESLPIRLPDHYRTQIEVAASLLSASDAVRFACDCTDRVLERWENLFPSDQRPRNALEAARSWLNGVGTAQSLKAAGRSASDAGTEHDDTSTLPDDRPELTAALYAADAASHAALAAQDATSAHQLRPPIPNMVFGAVGNCARFATHAAKDEHAERHWQKARLAELLLESENRVEHS